MTSIPRAAFRAAIQDAIREAAVPADAAMPLFRLAETATEVGRNFLDGPGCPLIQAGVVDPETVNAPWGQALAVGWPDWADDFVIEYDGRVNGYFDPYGSDPVAVIR